MLTVNGWRQTTVNDVCERVSVGIVIKPAQYYVDDDSGVRAFRSANVDENRIVDSNWVYLSHAGHAANLSSALEAGDVLVVRSGAPGTSCVVPPEFAGSNCIDLICARPNLQEILPEYLSAYTNSAVGKQHVAGNQSGLAQKHFNVGAYKRMHLLLPPISEQRKIVEILRPWDKAIEKLEELRAAKEQQLDGFTESLIHEGQSERMYLRDLLREISTRNTGQRVERVLSVTNSAGFVLADEQFAHRVASADLSNYKIVRRGQYAYNPSRINVGSIARLDAWDNGALSPMYVVFEVLPELDSDYFGHWLRSGEARKRIALAGQGSVRDTVKFGDLGSILIPVPILERQQAIAKALNAGRQELELLEIEINALTRQKRGLMQKLLTGEWRVSTDDEDESVDGKEITDAE